MNGERQGSMWNVIALIATLGLVAVVAVVAVTREDRTPKPQASESPTPSPSPSGSTPSELAGEGPYLVYALATREVFAYDVAKGESTAIGTIDEEAIFRFDRQPGDGTVVAFATQGSVVWRVDRDGLDRVALLPVNDARVLAGGTASRDGRRFAIASTGADPELILVNLNNGRTTAFRRESGANRYPREPLVPVGWSLGGSLVYQDPVCDCDDPSPGLYLYDLEAERSSILPPTTQAEFLLFAISPNGQQLIWAEEGTLRRLAAGRQSATVLRRSSDRLFSSVVWSADGASVLVAHAPADGGPRSTELVDPESGDRLRAVRGIPEQGLVLALLPDRLVVVQVGDDADRRLLTILDGAEKVVAEGDSPVFLGWIR